MSEIPTWMSKVESVAQEIAISHGCLLYDIEFVGAGKARVLRLYIDKEDGSIGLDDCAHVSRLLGEILDQQEDLVPVEEYNLEVSTPGLERHLKKPWHFQRAVGKKVYIKTSKSLESVGVTDKKWKAAKTVEQVVESADDAGVHFIVEGVEIQIPYSLIDKAKIVFEMNKGQKK